MSARAHADHFIPDRQIDTENTLRELNRRRAAEYRHGRGSLLDHLQGTSKILAAWRQPERVRLAGLIHSGYASEAFAHALFDLSERDFVREIVGEEAERLARLFCKIERETLFDVVGSLDANITGFVSLPGRQYNETLKLDRRDVGDLLAIYLANAADQACMDDGGPTYWLAPAAELALWAAKTAEVVPPIFQNGQARLSREEEEEALEAYDTGLRFIATDLDAAFVKLDRASRILPYVAEPLLWLACFDLARGHLENARRRAVQATAILGDWATPWDKRLSLDQWLKLAERVCAWGRLRGEKAEAISVAAACALTDVTNSPSDLFRGLADAGLADFPSEAGDSEQIAAASSGGQLQNLPHRFRKYLARRSFGGVSPAGVGMYPNLTAKPWHEPERFPIALALEQFANEIACELAALDETQFVDEAEDIARIGRWSVLFLSKPDDTCDAVRSLCPVTASILDQHLDETQRAGVAYFSCLAPGTKVAPHRGATNTRLRCHLGIEVPNGCGLAVGGSAGLWETGRCVIFDDSFIHEVWNTSANRRVVFIVDIWHPDLSVEEIALLKWLSS